MYLSQPLQPRLLSVPFTNRVVVFLSEIASFSTTCLHWPCEMLGQCYCFYFVIRVNETTKIWYFCWFFCVLFSRSNSTSSFFVFSFTFSKFHLLIVAFQTLLLHFNSVSSSLKLNQWIIVRITFAKFLSHYLWAWWYITTCVMLPICTFPRNMSSSVLHCILKLKAHLPSCKNVCCSIHSVETSRYLSLY
jgi:hypothetical protein